MQFVELAEVCFGRKRKRQNDLANFKLLVVRGADQSVVMSINLAGVKLNEREEARYSVVGSSSVSNVDLPWESDAVQSIYPKDLAIPVGDDSAYAVILINSISAPQMKMFNLQKSGDVYESLKLTQFMEKTLRSINQDMIVYGRRVHTNRCEIFERLWPDGTILTPTRRYLLRDFDSSNPELQSQDYSLNRCTSGTDPHTPEAFQTDAVSPGLKNPCQGKSFFLEDYVTKITPINPPLQPEEVSVEECESDIINAPPEMYRDMSEDQFFKTREQELNKYKRQCIRPGGSETEYSEAEILTDKTDQRIKSFGVTPMNLPYRVNTFQTEWISLTNVLFPPNRNPLMQKDIQEWIMVKQDTSKAPSEGIRFFCKICVYQISHHFAININAVKSIMTEKGFIGDTLAKNALEIERHSKDNAHLAAESFQRSILARKHKEDLKTIIKDLEEAEGGLLQPTFRMIRTVYMEAKTGIPFSKHEDIVKLQKANGVNLGTHAFHDKAAADITKIISQQMHKRLLRRLINDDVEFSILVDATTDSRNIPYFIVYIQTIEDNAPVIYFYRLIVLEKGESADATIASFWSAIQKDTTEDLPFEDYVKRKLIVFSSDGAAVMVGSRHSFHTLLREKVNNKELPAVICMAHKLQNTFRRAVTTGTNPIPYFKAYDKKITKFYNFYSSRGSKRWAHFVDVANSLGLNYRRLRKHIDIRWAASEYEVLRNLLTDYAPLRHDLVSIVADSDFTEDAKKQATELFELMQDKSWVVVLHEMMDVMTVFKFVSLGLQERAGVIAGKLELIQKGLAKLKELKTSNGGYLSNFLKETTCQTEPVICVDSTGCTLQQYEQCEVVVWKTEFALTDEDTDGKKSGFLLSTVKEKLYTELVKQFHHYFNMEELEAFEIFNQKLYDVPTCEATFVTGFLEALEKMKTSQSITKLCKFYSISEEHCKKMVDDWPILMTELLEVPSYVQNLQTEVEFFWPLVLRNDGNKLTALTPELQLLIQRMLTTPFGTAECKLLKY